MDSLVNLIIFYQKSLTLPPFVNESTQCILGVITTIAFKNVSLLSIILRSRRIRSFFDTYADYMSE